MSSNAIQLHGDKITDTTQLESAITIFATNSLYSDQKSNRIVVLKMNPVDTRSSFDKQMTQSDEHKKATEKQVERRTTYDAYMIMKTMPAPQYADTYPDTSDEVKTTLPKSVTVTVSISLLEALLATLAGRKLTTLVYHRALESQNLSYSFGYLPSERDLMKCINMTITLDLGNRFTQVLQNSLEEGSAQRDAFENALAKNQSVTDYLSTFTTAMTQETAISAEAKMLTLTDNTLNAFGLKYIREPFTSAGSAIEAQRTAFQALHKELKKYYPGEKLVDNEEYDLICGLLLLHTMRDHVSDNGSAVEIVKRFSNECINEKPLASVIRNIRYSNLHPKFKSLWRTVSQLPAFKDPHSAPPTERGAAAKEREREQPSAEMLAKKARNRRRNARNRKVRQQRKAERAAEAKQAITDAATTANTPPQQRQTPTVAPIGHDDINVFINPHDESVVKLQANPKHPSYVQPDSHLIFSYKYTPATKANVSETSNAIKGFKECMRTLTGKDADPEKLKLIQQVIVTSLDTQAACDAYTKRSGIPTKILKP